MLEYDNPIDNKVFRFKVDNRNLNDRKYFRKIYLNF